MIENMYEVIVRTYCIGGGYGTYNEINVPFDSCYDDKINAVKAYDDQFLTYYRKSEGDWCCKGNDSFKIEKKRNDYSIIIKGSIIIKEDKKK